MSKGTPTHRIEPWHFVFEHSTGEVYVRDEHNVIIAKMRQHEGLAHTMNAQRIVDCVNAMKGILDPSNLRATWDAIQHLELDKYKDLKEAVQSLIQGIDNGMHMKPDSIIVEALRQAIK